MLGRPRFEPLEAQQAAQAVELLSALILAAERPVLGRADEPGRSGAPRERSPPAALTSCQWLHIRLASQAGRKRRFCRGSGW